MLRRVAVVPGALVLVGVLVGAACSSGSSSTASLAPASSTAAPSSSVAATATSAATTTALSIAPAGSASAAAKSFIDAWRNEDRDAALTIAVASAVDEAFASGEPGSVENRGCNEPPPGSPVLCVYRTAVGEVQLRVAPRPDGWFVDQARVSPA